MGMCYITNCKSKSVKGGPISFYKLPKDKSIAEKWLVLCRPKTAERSDARVCSKHFLPSDYRELTIRERLMKDLYKTQRQLKETAIPSQELDSDEYDKQNSISISVAEYKELKKRVEDAETKYSEVQNECTKIKQKLGTIFSPGQVQSLVLNKPVKWSDEDILAAMSLQVVSPRAYRHLRNIIGIPLPSICTIKRWAAKFEKDKAIVTVKTEPAQEPSSSFSERSGLVQKILTK